MITVAHSKFLKQEKVKIMFFKFSFYEFYWRSPLKSIILRSENHKLAPQFITYMRNIVAAEFNSALFALSDDRKLPWFGSNFALCCFGQSFADSNRYLALSWYFLELFSFSTPLLSFRKLVQNFAAFNSVSSFINKQLVS